MSGGILGMLFPKSQGLPQGGAAPSPSSQMLQTSVANPQPANPHYERNKEFAKPGPYITSLEPHEETQFQQWVKQNNVPLEDDGPTSSYDMRGFWKALQSGDPRAQSAINPVDKRLHFPDIWKTPYHPTFSNESMYATPNNPFFWKGETLIDKRSNKPIFQTQPK